MNCVPGADGGTPQYFLLEVRGTARRDPVQSSAYSPTLHAPQSDQGTVGGEAPPIYQERNPRPSFQIRGLDPGLDYTFYVYAVNGQGRSEPVLLENVRVAEVMGEGRIERNGLFLEDLKKALPKSSPENVIIVVALTGTGKRKSKRCLRFNVSCNFLVIFLQVSPKQKKKEKEIRRIFESVNGFF